MNTTAFVITTISGISTLLGFAVIWIKGDINKSISAALGIAAGVMFFVSLFDLMPSSLIYFESSVFIGFHVIFCLLFFAIGIVLSAYINRKINGKMDNSDSLYKIGILSMIAIIIHNVPEGIITYLTTTVQYRTGLFLAISIACHNIPEGICIAAPIYYATNSKKKTFFALLVSSLSEPIGALIAAIFFEKNMSMMFIAILLSTVAGIMISLVFTEIIPEAIKHSLKNTILYFFIGIIAMGIAHLLF